MMSISGVQMDLRDVAYYVKRKQGFPSITDTGVADIFLGGSGLSFKIKLSTASKKDQQNFFKVDKVDVDVKNFNVKLKESNHRVLFALFKPIMLWLIRPALQKALEEVIKEKVHAADRFAYQVKLEADKARREVAHNPESTQNVYRRYTSAAQRQLTKGKQKASAASADKKVNLAMTQQDSIFPNIHLPGGISSKATEYKELAAKGETWNTPVFSLGSALPSTDIPKAGPIICKSHVTGGSPGLSPTPSGHVAAATNGVGRSGSATSGFGDQVDVAFAAAPVTET